MVSFSSSLLLRIQQATEIIVAEGIDHVDRYYGPNGKYPQEYHHPQHTSEVIQGCVDIGALALQNHRITEIEFFLGKIAGAWHDGYYDAYTKTFNEEKSAALARKSMGRFTCFGDEHIEIVERCILATRVTGFYPRLVQSANPDEYIQGVVADADLSYFGWVPAEFLPRATSYLKELERTMGQKPLRYLMNNVVLLRNHQWNTAEAGILYPNFDKNIEALNAHQTLYAVQ